MKKYLILLLMGAVMLSLLSCGSAKGIQAKQAKKDLNIEGMPEIDKFDPARKVLASDSLYFSLPPDGKVQQLRIGKNKKSYILPNGMQKLPLYIYQLNKGTYTPEDYLWAFQAVRDGAEVKVKPLNMNAFTTKAKKSNNSKVAGGSNALTFDLYGTKIKATIINDTSMIDYRPCLLSFFLTSDLPIKMIHYSYNNIDYKMYDLNNPDEFMSLGDRIFVKEINLNYGDRFGLITDDGMTPNISPYQIKEGNISLSGVTLIENSNSGSSFYVFRVLWSGSDAMNNMGAIAGEKNSSRSSFNDDQDSKILFGKVRTADLMRYRNGYIRIKIQDIAQDAWPLFEQLANMVDGNGERAIGLGKDGKLYPTVIVSPGIIKNFPELYDKYKNRIQYPK